MRSLFRDVRYGIRSLIKSPGLSLVATIALAFGIGLTTTMFSIIYGAWMKGLPFPDGDRIVAVFRNNLTVGAQQMGVPISDYEEYRTQQRSFETLAAWYTGTVNVSGTAEAERFGGAFVTPSMFRVAPARPVLGRTLQEGEEGPGAPRVAVISYGMWRRRFGGDPDVVGQNLRANGNPFTIVGVMPEGYEFPGNASIWLPLPLDPVGTPRGEGQWLSVAGKLRPSVSIDAATMDLNAIARRLQEEWKATNENIGAVARPFVDAFIGDEPKKLLYTMLGAVFFVLLIACANVANLLLDRAAHRSKEVGIRTALGASRGAVVRQFLAEALALSLAGAFLGTLLAQLDITLFTRAIADSEPPFFIDIALHPPVLAFVIGVALISTFFSGIIPALQSSRADINEVLKDETRGSSSLKIGRMSRGLVVLEIALSCGLLVASGLMIKSVTQLRNMDPGFDPRNVFTARLGFPAGYTDTLAQQQFYEQLRARLGEMPGAQGAAIASQLPGVGANGTRFMVEGETYATDRDLPDSRWLAVSPGFFETFAFRVLQGRVIDDRDRADGLPVAVVNQAFAERYFAGADPIGRRFRPGGLTSERPWVTVVGVVPTMYTGDPEEPRDPFFYVPLAQAHSNFVSLAVRTSGPPLAITSDVRRTVASLDQDIPIYWVYSMDEALARPTWYIRIFGTMFMIFGVIALFLASVGLYAVMSFSVSRRLREVGIRMALGAQGRDVLRLVFRQGAWQLAVGLVLGLALAAGLGNLVQVILFEVKPRDPAIFGGVVAVLALTGFIACLVPARRAMRIDPLIALRTE